MNNIIIEMRVLILFCQMLKFEKWFYRILKSHALNEYSINQLILLNQLKCLLQPVFMRRASFVSSTQNFLCPGFNLQNFLSNHLSSALPAVDLLFKVIDSLLKVWRWYFLSVLICSILLIMSSCVSNYTRSFCNAKAPWDSLCWWKYCGFICFVT